MRLMSGIFPFGNGFWTVREGTSHPRIDTAACAYLVRFTWQSAKCSSSGTVIDVGPRTPALTDGGIWRHWYCRLCKPVVRKL